MPNTVSLSAAIDSERTQITISDGTTFTDPLRADCAVYFSSAKVDYAGEETDVEVTSDDDNPLTDSEWSFEYLADGYWKMRYIQIPDYNISTAYDQYDAVNSGGTVYRAVTSSTGQSVSNTAYWVPVTDPTSLCDNKGGATESQNCVSLVYERVFTSNAQYAYGNLIAENCMCTDCDPASLINDYDIFSLWLNGAIKCDERTQPLSGELIARRIQSKFIDA